jgi:hypothetical protein
MSKIAFVYLNKKVMKELTHYLTDYNITSVIQQFNSQFYRNFNFNF